MTDLIFVYGSLMRTVPSAASLWLQQNASFIAEDSVPGALYDVGRYPGLVLSPEANTEVFGEVHRLYKPEVALAYLDEYEGTALEHPEYNRLQCTTSAGFHCWFYQLLTYHQDYPPIPGGDYNTFYPTNLRHLTFIGRSDASTSN